MVVKKMSLTWIAVSDIKKAQDFFGNTLGLKLSSGCEEYNWFEFVGTQDGSMLGIGQAADGENCGINPGQNAVVTMTVDDIVAAKKELEAKGVKFFGDIQEVPGHVKLALFADPDGNKFQLVQELDMKK